MMHKTLLLSLLLIHLCVGAQTIKIDIDAYRMIYSPEHHKAYAAVESQDPQYPNSILQLNPLNGTVEKHIALNGTPFILRQTADEEYLYVSYQQGPAITKIELAGFTAVNELTAGNSSILDFAVTADDDNTLLVIRGDQGYPDDIVMYKNGVLQPKQVSAGFEYYSALSIRNNGSQVYAHDRCTSGSEGLLLNILNDGLEAHGKIWDYQMPGSSFIKNHGDLLYDDSGNVLDAFSDSIPKLVARMPLYRITDEHRTGFEYSNIHGSYVYGHALNYKCYISFFHGENYNYMGSFKLDKEIEIVYDLAVVDADHFILVGLHYSGENKCLLFYTSSSKDRLVLDTKASLLKAGNRKWGD